jgi:hypothetical protein
VLALALIAISLAGCASSSPDSGMDVVRDIAAAELNKEAFKTDTAEKTAAAEGRVRRLLSAPLSANAAVEIALLDNKGLQAAYDDLGMAEAEKVEASLPPNPAFSASGISTPVELDDEARLAADVLALATLPVRAAIADDRFRQAQLAAAAQTLRIGVEARRNYYTQGDAFAAGEAVGLPGDEFLGGTEALAFDLVRRLGLRLGEPGFLIRCERRAGRERVEPVAIVYPGRARLLVLGERWRQHRRALEHQPLRRPDHPVDNRAFEQLAARADHVPAEAGNPAPIVQSFRNRTESDASCTAI